MNTSKASPGQIKRILALNQETLKNTVLSTKGAQRLIEKGGEFQKHFQLLIHELSGERYVDEEVASDCGYPKGFKILPLEQQLDILHKYFPETSFDATNEFLKKEWPKLKLPKEAEGWGVIPRLEKIAKDYHAAVERAMDELTSSRSFYDNYFLKVAIESLQRDRKTRIFLAQLAIQQKGDFLIFPIQFGLRHAGRSSRRAYEIFTEQEFALGVFENICLLLTHLKRFSSKNDLWIDCAGDKCKESIIENEKRGIPCLGMRSYGGIELSHAGYDTECIFSGSSSGFLIQR